MMLSSWTFQESSCWARATPADRTTREALTEGKKNLRFNLGDVTYVDSAGLGALISCYSSAAREGGRLKLLNLTGKIQDLLAITRLISIFEIYNDEREAVASFA